MKTVLTLALVLTLWCSLMLLAAAAGVLSGALAGVLPPPHLYKCKNL